MRTLTTFLQPLEWLHVGPPSSAPAGESHHTPSLFPPPASTWQGVLRSALLRAVPDLALGPGSDRNRIQVLVGRPESLPEGWQMDGPWPAGPGQLGLMMPWLPVPAWLIEEADTPADVPGPREIATAEPFDDVEGWCSGGPNGLDPEGWGPWTVRTLRRPAPSSGWLSVADLLRLLAGDPRGVDVRPLPPFVHADLRPGVAVCSDGSPRPGMLYFLEAHRFDDEAGLLGGVSGPLGAEIPDDALHRGTAVIGRKHRHASLHRPPPSDPAWALFTAGAHLPETLAEGARVWVGLSTPALIETDAERLRPTLPLSPEAARACVTLKVRSTLLHKDLVRGGLRLRGREHPEILPNRPWLAAGSGWLVEVGGGDDASRAAAVRALHHRCLLGPDQLRRFGAGRLMVGLDPAPSRPIPGPVSPSAGA